MAIARLCEFRFGIQLAVGSNPAAVLQSTYKSMHATKGSRVGGAEGKVQKVAFVSSCSMSRNICPRRTEQGRSGLGEV